jgi:hypothetical protein
MNSFKLIPSLLVAVALPVGVSGCGESGASASAQNAGAPKVTLASTGISVPGDQPVSTEILIDRTALLRGDSTLARLYKQVALQAAAPTIARGGNLRVRVFGRVAAHALVLYTAQIPALAEVGDAGRDDRTQTAALEGVLDVAVGVVPAPNKTVADAIAQVTKVEGSDIGAMIGRAIIGLGDDRSPTRNIVVVTDGWIMREAQPLLSHVLARRGAGAAAEQIVANAAVSAGTRPISLLMIAGLGLTAGFDGPGAKTNQQLDEAYQQACARLPVQTCEIATSS